MINFQIIVKMNINIEHGQKIQFTDFNEISVRYDLGGVPTTVKVKQKCSIVKIVFLDDQYLVIL